MSKDRGLHFMQPPCGAVLHPLHGVISIRFVPVFLLVNKRYYLLISAVSFPLRCHWICGRVVHFSFSSFLQHFNTDIGDPTKYPFVAIYLRS